MVVNYTRKRWMYERIVKLEVVEIGKMRVRVMVTNASVEQTDLK